MLNIKKIFLRLAARLWNLIFCSAKQRVLFAVVLCGCGCVDTTNPSLLTAVSLTAGGEKIIVSAPQGFCVDQKLAKKARGSTTLFIIDCVKIKSSNGVITRRRPLSAILTATVIDLKSPKIDTIESLEELLTKKPWINYLSRSNTNTVLKVHQIQADNNLLFFLIEQRMGDIDVKQSHYFWRVFFFINGRIISMTASNFSDDIESQRKLRQLVQQFANNTLIANVGI